MENEEDGKTEKQKKAKQSDMMNQVNALFYKSALHLRKIRDAEAITESEKEISSNLHTDSSMQDYDVDVEYEKILKKDEEENQIHAQ